VSKKVDSKRNNSNGKAAADSIAHWIVRLPGLEANKQRNNTTKQHNRSNTSAATSMVYWMALPSGLEASKEGNDTSTTTTTTATTHINKRNVPRTSKKL
jgi:hypothetical protein